MKILLIDNNDSFTNNLEHLLANVISGVEIVVLPYAQAFFVDGKPTDFNQFDLLIISPGPGCPENYPGYEIVIESGRPVLGICLGMQIINEYYGGVTDRLSGCFHGRTEAIDFDREQLDVARYHSLYCSRVGEGLEVFSANAEGVPMALRHTDLPLMGYQFHPESFLTEQPGVFIQYALDFFEKSQL